MSDLAELNRAIGRVEGKLDTFIEQMKTQDERATNVEVRMRKVENRQHWYSGVAAAIGMLITSAGMHTGIFPK